MPLCSVLYHNSIAIGLQAQAATHFEVISFTSKMGAVGTPWACALKELQDQCDAGLEASLKLASRAETGREGMILACFPPQTGVCHLETALFGTASSFLGHLKAPKTASGSATTAR